jgi:hypothetical protein
LYPTCPEWVGLEKAEQCALRAAFSLHGSCMTHSHKSFKKRNQPSILMLSILLLVATVYCIGFESKEQVNDIAMVIGFVALICIIVLLRYLYGSSGKKKQEMKADVEAPVPPAYTEQPVQVVEESNDGVTLNDCAKPEKVPRIQFHPKHWSGKVKENYMYFYF